MNYTLDRFPSRDQPDVMEALRDTVQLSTLAGSLGRLLSKRSENDKKRKHAQEAMTRFIATASKVEAEEQGPDMDLMGRFLGRVLKFVGKRVVKAAVRPILRFAGRMAMNIIRVAARTVLRFVIFPVLEALVALAIANPVTAGILAAGAVIGGGVYLWKKYFSSPDVEDLVSYKEVDTNNIAEVETDQAEIGPQAVVEQQATVAPEVYEKSTLETIAAPIKKALAAPIAAVKSATTSKKKKGKFTGFGNDVDGYIHEAVRLYPTLPLAELRGFIKMEGGWTGAMSPTGAIGTGQFIQPTWDALAAMPEGEAIGMTKIGKRFRKPDDPRFDKRINTLATGLLASQNAKALKKAKLPVNGANLYMMHNIGPGIIPVMLGKPASESTLLAMRQNGMTKNMTAAQFLAFQKGRFQEAFVAANTVTDTAADQPQMAKALTLEAAKKQKTGTANTSTQLLPGAGHAPDAALIKGPGKSIVRM